MCVILHYKDIDTYLLKNRDKTYLAKIKIVHKLVDGVEIVYIYDIDTKWIEGMNEFGIGIINSVLLVKQDEIFRRTSFKGSDGEKMLNALKQTNIKDCLSSILNYTGKSDISLKGHTLLSDSVEGYHVESTTVNTNVSKIRKPIVCTNHGIYDKDAGYKLGNKKISSILRKEIIEHELKKLNKKNNIVNIIDIITKNYDNIHPKHQPYRDKQLIKKTIPNYNENIKIIATTSQIVMNLTKKQFLVRVDKFNGEVVDYENKLPLNYKPKIKVAYMYTTKNTNIDKCMLPSTYINNIINKYKYIKQKYKYILIR